MTVFVEDYLYDQLESLLDHIEEQVVLDMLHNIKPLSSQYYEKINFTLDNEQKRNILQSIVDDFIECYSCSTFFELDYKYTVLCGLIKL